MDEWMNEELIFKLPSKVYLKELEAKKKEKKRACYVLNVYVPLWNPLQNLPEDCEGNWVIKTKKAFIL